ncbi:restriction endonuclease subunit S [Campylobacter concisus]|uniref:restriction endonuclease subunit S n=1 Tax=Campylobacter concisus TaxID=199 RepID=UPI0009344A23|nr:restriction endonuclease subunit S [Campylobacter concisus]
MSEFKNLPSGWKVVRLGDVAEKSILKNRNSSIKLVLSNSAIDGLVAQNEYFDKDIANKENIQDYYIVDLGDFVYNPRISQSAPTGPINRNMLSKGIVSPLYTVFTVQDEILAKFLEYFFKTIVWQNQVKSVANYGARHDRINITDNAFFSLKILTPPLDEQKKIAEILSTWDEAINLTINLIESKKQFKKALMQNLLTAKIRFPEFKGEWREIRLGNIGKSYNGLIGKVAEDFQNGNSNFITYKNIFDNPKIDINIFEKVKIMEDEEQNLVKFGDIFFTTSSETPNEVGISSVLLSKCGILYLNSFCFGFRLNNFEILSPCFAVFYFRSDCFRKQIFKLAQGSTRFNISKTEVLNLNIKIPNLDEQQKVAKALTACDDEINLLNLKLENLKKQKQGLMQKLLKGEIRTCYVKKAM